MAFINKARDTLSRQGTQLAVALVPAKARLYLAYLGAAALPACRTALYADARAALSAMGIPVTDIMARMRSAPGREGLYLRTDTHWSPAGARLAAMETGRLIRSAYPGLQFPGLHFLSKTGEERAYAGDLMRYLPGVSLTPDHIVSVTTEEAPVVTANADATLLGDAPAPQTVLVGTSYSANPAWNFAGFLKEALRADVLNTSDEGEGPFAVMDKYLNAAGRQSAPPRLVVWEIPERYLLYPHGVTGPK
jgi:alginate O-acetyltransferase complex protein AlgJ